jgi:hypothetical protein
MLCASGFEFEEKLHLAEVERENAQRIIQSVSDLNQSTSKRFEEAVKRYNKRLSDFVNHKRVCTLCREAQNKVRGPLLANISNIQSRSNRATKNKMAM